MVVLGLMVSHDHNFQYFPPNLGIGAAAKLLQSCPTLCDPIDSTHQAPPSLGFSRPEHWSGLSFPSPMHESEKWKRSRSVMSDPQQPHGLQPSRLPHPWDFPGKSTGVGCHCLLQIWHRFTPSMKQKQTRRHKRKDSWLPRRRGEGRSGSLGLVDENWYIYNG